MDMAAGAMMAARIAAARARPHRAPRSPRQAGAVDDFDAEPPADRTGERQKVVVERDQPYVLSPRGPVGGCREYHKVGPVRFQRGASPALSMPLLDALPPAHRAGLSRVLPYLGEHAADIFLMPAVVCDFKGGAQAF